MSKITKDSATVEAFITWMKERHGIWQRRELGMLRPWTEDPIMRKYKFTNVYRQLDRGTIALENLIKLCVDNKHRLFTIIWYRMFNVDVHANHFVTVGRAPIVVSQVIYHMRLRKRKGLKVFTSAHITASEPYMDKISSFEKILNQAYGMVPHLLDVCATGSMEKLFHALKMIDYVGKFMSYEMVCDARFYLIVLPVDNLTWCSLGPGAVRGMQRLGLPSTVDGVRDLYEQTKGILECKWPFEMREVEHSLCEFDKYERARLNQGRPRENFDGMPSVP